MARAYIFPMRGQPGFRTTPIARYIIPGDDGVDIPILTDIWTQEGETDETSIEIVPVTRSFHRWNTATEHYSIHYLRPFDTSSRQNKSLQQIPCLQAMTGEFVIYRLTPDSKRFRDMRLVDVPQLDRLMLRYVSLMISTELQ